MCQQIFKIMVLEFSGFCFVDCRTTCLLPLLGCVAVANNNGFEMNWICVFCAEIQMCRKSEYS